MLQDNPSLNVRWTKCNEITKVILDSKLRTPGQAKLFASSDRVIIFHSRNAAKKRVASLAKKAELIEVSGEDGLLDWKEILDRLGQSDVTSLIIEGGSRVAASALQAKTVQKINFFYGPKMIGSGGRAGIGDLGIDRLKEAVNWEIHSIRHFPPDFMVEAYPG